MFNNNQPSDKKTFNLQLRNTKLFAIAVTTINKISGWGWNLRIKTVIVSNALLQTKFIILFTSKTRIASFFKALWRFAGTTIKIPRVRSQYLFRMLMRIVQPLVIKSPRMILAFKMIFRMLQTVKIPRVRIAYTVVVAQFIILGNHDYSDYPINTSARTLGNRDTLTLLQMDGTYY